MRLDIDPEDPAEFDVPTDDEAADEDEWNEELADALAAYESDS